MGLPKSGVPRVLSGLTTASLDSGLAVMSVRDIWTPGQLAHAILREVDEACSVIIKPSNGKFWASSHADVIGLWQEMLDSYTPKLIVAPETNGLLSHWVQVLSDGIGLPAQFHANNRMSLEQVAQIFATDETDKFILVSQTTGQVSLMSDMLDNSGEENAAYGASLGPSWWFELRDKSTTRLAFE
jgi:hypothetical protein